MFKYFLTLCLVLLPVLSYAGTDLPMDSFGKLPVLHDGRIKPLDSFARIELLRFSKKDKLNEKQAIVWLADTLFNPADATNEKIFLINNANSRHLLGLEDRKKPLYSFAELSSGLEKTTPLLNDLMATPAKQRTTDEKDILAIHDNALEYTLILRSFSSALPLNIHLPPSWAAKAGLKPTDTITYTALKKIEPELESSIRAIIKHKGSNPEHYTAAEQATTMLGWQLRVLGKAGEGNTLFRIIPLDTNDNWASPWEIINDGKGTPATGKIIANWGTIAKSWQEKDLSLWTSSVQTANAFHSLKLDVEILYNIFSPFTLSIFIFAAAMILSLLHLAKPHILFYRTGLLAILVALGVQGLGMLTRVYIMGRPPVGTLYESLLFVGLIAPCVALALESRFKNGMGIMMGGISGAILGILALSMAGEGDTMKVLGAVLNTQFWLSTHVLCITIGYGWCLVTSVMAHIILVGRARHGFIAGSDTHMTKTLTTLSLFSIMFTTIGTILGGIWADQSWGRFWGWDPKENGALLIVLWLIWVIHGKIAAQISEIIWVSGMAFLSVIVVTAWIGVNLLGVGLHSYGFIEGVFWGIGAFTLLEIIVIASLNILIRKNNKGVTHAA